MYNSNNIMIINSDNSGWTRYSDFFLIPGILPDINYSASVPSLIIRDEDPVLAKNRIRGSVPQTKGDFLKSFE